MVRSSFFETPSGDDLDEPYGSSVVLLKDGKPVGPARTIHERIRTG
jgi:hypothetical protein